MAWRYLPRFLVPGALDSGEDAPAVVLDMEVLPHLVDEPFDGEERGVLRGDDERGPPPEERVVGQPHLAAVGHEQLGHLHAVRVAGPPHRAAALREPTCERVRA